MSRIQRCERADSMGVECEKPELESRIARLEADNAALQAQLAGMKPTKFDELMLDPEFRNIYAAECAKADIETEQLQAENAALKAQVQRLSAPLSDEEWQGRYIFVSGCHSRLPNGVREGYVNRRAVDYIISARVAAPPTKEKP